MYGGRNCLNTQYYILQQRETLGHKAGVNIINYYVL